MEDRLVKVLPVGELLSLWLYESAKQDGGAWDVQMMDVFFPGHALNERAG